MYCHTMFCRSSATGEGHFFFTGKRSKQLFKLLESLSAKARPARLAPSRSMDMLSSGTSSSKSLDIPTSAELTDSNGYLKVFPTVNFRSLSPRGNSRFMVPQDKSFSAGKCI